MVREINTDEFKKEILDYDGCAVVDFYSTECPPCEALHPKFESLDEFYGNEIKFIRMFRQGNRELASELGVKGSPTLLFYSKGKEVAPRLTGAIKKSAIMKTLTDNLNMPDKYAGMERKTLDYDLVIIGGGPAGLTSAIYAGRAKLKTIVIEQGLAGGQVNITDRVANYPGTGEEIGGYALMEKFATQVKANNVEILAASEIHGINLGNKTIIVDDDKVIKAKSIILATGAKPKEIGIPGEKEFAGRGISYCATCDGRYFEGKDIFVIGGGNSAVEESIFLTRYARKITMISRYDYLKANKTASEELLKNPKVEVMWSHEPRSFIGNGKFEKLEVEDLKTGERKTLSGREGYLLS